MRRVRLPTLTCKRWRGVERLLFFLHAWSKNIIPICSPFKASPAPPLTQYFNQHLSVIPCVWLLLLSYVHLPFVFVPSAFKLPMSLKTCSYFPKFRVKGFGFEGFPCTQIFRRSGFNEAVNIDTICVVHHLNSSFNYLLGCWILCVATWRICHLPQPMRSSVTSRSQC